MKKILSLVLCLTVLLSSTTVFAIQPYAGFTDLGPDHWAYQAVMQMVSKGILEGYGDGTFRPDEPVTRAQFAKILVLSLRLALKDSGDQIFADVPSNDWSYQYVQASQKFLTGYKNKQDGKFYFKGDNVAVREDMAVAVVIAKGLNNQSADLSVLDSFSDKDSISPSLKKYIAIAVDNHIMDGYGNGLFGPQNTLTRAEAAELMYKSGILDSSDDKIAVGGDKNSQPGNVFDFKTVKVGDKVAGMTVAIINGGNLEAAEIDTNGIGAIMFSGQATISGTYKIIHEGMDSKDVIYLALDKESRSKIPQYFGEQLSEIPIGDLNGSAIMKKFEEVGTAGKFKIVIDDYFKSFAPEIGSSDAEVVKIIELTKDSNNSELTVASTSPAGGATDVDINAPIVITYSEPAENASMSKDGIEIKNQYGQPVEFNILDAPGQKTTTLTPKNALQSGATYTVSIAPRVMVDYNNNYMTNSYSFSFMTKAADTAQTYDDGKITFKYPLDYKLHVDDMGGAYSGGKYGNFLVTSYDSKIGYTTLKSTTLTDVYNAALTEYRTAAGKTIAVYDNAIAIFTNKSGWYYYDIYGRGIGSTVPHIQLMLTSVEMSSDQKKAIDQVKDEILNTFSVISSEQPINNGPVAVQLEKVFNDGNIKFSYPATLILNKSNQTTVSGYQNYTGTVGDCTVQVQYIKWDKSNTDIDSIGEYLSNLYSSQTPKVFQGGWVSNTFMGSSLDDTKPFQDLIYGRGIGNVVPLITITTSKPSGQYYSGDQELLNYLSLRDKIANSLEVVSTTPSANN